MNITDNLIQQFFQGKCSQMEASAVLHYLAENPDAAEKHLGKSEWRKATITADIPLPQVQRDRILAKIKLATYKKPIIKLTVHQFTTAASLLLVMFIGFQFYIQNHKTAPDFVKLNKEQDTWQHLNNTSSKIISLVLKDGTKVKMYAHSKISFPKIPLKNKRDIKLFGKAFFEVAKDQKRPFTVISGGISITAVGTQFTVDASKEDQLISVRLYEGKVLVKKIDSIGKNSFEPLLLLPGQELVYEKLKGLTSLKNFNEIQANQKSALANNDGHSNLNISFLHEPIENVLKAIEKAYQIDLIYPQALIKDHYFTGSFHIKEDSLARILHILSATNKLNITKTKSGYKIAKSAD